MQGIPTKARMLEEPASSSISKQIATIIILEKCSVRQNKIYSQAHWAFPGMILTFFADLQAWRVWVRAEDEDETSQANVVRWGSCYDHKTGSNITLIIHKPVNGFDFTNNEGTLRGLIYSS